MLLGLVRGWRYRECWDLVVPPLASPVIYTSHTLLPPPPPVPLLFLKLLFLLAGRCGSAWQLLSHQRRTLDLAEALQLPSSAGRADTNSPWEGIRAPSAGHKDTGSRDRRTLRRRKSPG
uniref:Uncharacterized protein n=1 Tax=Malurus cyaneus samueli TaxID=2593467 RepID=A0A8C5THA8_9PASS